MATTSGPPQPSIEDLEQMVKSLGLSKIPKQPNTYPELNPVDIYRSHITELLASISGVEEDVIYRAVQWTQTLDKGDLVIAVPALRQKGKKPEEYAKELASKV